VIFSNLHLICITASMWASWKVLEDKFIVCTLCSLSSGHVSWQNVHFSHTCITEGNELLCEWNWQANNMEKILLSLSNAISVRLMQHSMFYSISCHLHVPECNPKYSHIHRLYFSVIHLLWPFCQTSSLAWCNVPWFCWQRKHFCQSTSPILLLLLETTASIGSIAAHLK